jgi:hypothetical protein
MVDVDTSIGQQLLDVAIRQAVAQVPAHRYGDDLTREAVRDGGNDEMDLELNI